MNIPELIFENLVSVFCVKNTPIHLCRSGSGMEKVGSGIRDKHPGSAALQKNPAKLSLLAYPYFLSFLIALLWSVPPLPLSKGLPVPLVPQFPSFSSVEVLSISNF